MRSESIKTSLPFARLEKSSMREDWLQAIARKLEWSGLPFQDETAKWLSDQANSGDFDAGDAMWLFEFLTLEASKSVLSSRLVGILGFESPDVTASLLRPTFEHANRVEAVCRALYAIIRSERATGAAAVQIRHDLGMCLAYKHTLLGALSIRQRPQATHFAKAIGHYINACPESLRLATIHSFWLDALRELKKNA